MFKFPLIFSFLKKKKLPPPSCACRLQKRFTFFVCAILVIFQSTSSGALRPVKKQHFIVKFWNWGPLTIWRNMTSVRFFSSQKPLHPTDHLFLLQILSIQHRIFVGSRYDFSQFKLCEKNPFWFFYWNFCITEFSEPEYAVLIKFWDVT